MRFAAVCTMVLGIAAAPAAAQISLQPTDPPTVVADNQGWYVDGEPIAFGGAIYLPAGAITHFLRNEMVPVGSFDGVPVYRRTTVEPGSVVYVPLSGGLVRPYERRRTGDLAGTTGSTSPGFPIVLPTDTARMAETLTPATPDGILERPVATSGQRALALAAEPAPVGTSGIAQQPAPVAPGRLESARRPVGVNNVFLEFEGTRYFASGPAVELAADRFERVGEYRGFGVYRQRDAGSTIYVALVSGTPGLLAPYTSSRASRQR